MKKYILVLLLFIFIIPSIAFASQLSITTTSCPSGTQYVAYAGCTIVGDGGIAPYTFSWKVVTDGSYATLPEGLILNSSTGAITGTVYGEGTYGVQFVVTDVTGAIATKNISFAIAGDSTLGGCSLFPSNSIFHTNISTLPVDTSPAAPIPAVYQSATIKPFFGSASVGNNPNGIPFIRVPWNQSLANISTTLYQHYFTSGPFPSYSPIEGTSNNTNDRHALVLQMAGGGNPCKLWEMWQGINIGNNAWSDSSNVVWQDLTSNTLTPLGGTNSNFDGTTDAAGLPILPLLLTYDEVASGTVAHPIRFTLNHMEHNYVWPATTGYAGMGSCAGVRVSDELSQSSPPSACPFSGPAGEIYRLKANVSTPSACSGDPQSLTIIQAFRNYGIILADNGISGGLIGTPDTRWSDSQLSCLTNLHLSDFEPVNVSSIMVDPDSAATSSSISPTYVPRITNPLPISSITTNTNKNSYDFGSVTLKNGSSGSAVKELQRFLNDTLNFGLVLDGKLGPKTIAFIKKWQQTHGLVADGLVGTKTKAMMQNSVQ